MNYKVYGKLMKYDTDILAEHLSDLRTQRQKGKLTYVQLSEEIFDKTGISISHSQLNKYERLGNTEAMSVNNLLALAEFYNVSIEYLLGINDSKSTNVTDKHTATKFGLTDKSMDRLKSLKNNNTILLKVVNCILEDDDFWKDFPPLVSDYFEVSERKNNLDFERKELEIAKFSLCELFKETLDRVFEKVRHPSKKLFDIPKKRRSTKIKREEQ